MEQEDELVSPQPRRRIRSPETVPDPLCDADQHLVAEIVAQRIIDLLEAVQIDENHGKGLVLSFAQADRMIDALVQQHPVGQAGQGVAIGQFLDALHRGHLLGEILEKHDVVQRLLILREDADDGRLGENVRAVTAAAIDFSFPGVASGELFPQVVFNEGVFGSPDDVPDGFLCQGIAGKSRQFQETRVDRGDDPRGAGDTDGFNARIEYLGGQLQAGLVGQLLRNVPERIYPSDGLSARELGPGYALQNGSVLQRDNIPRFIENGLADRLDPALVFRAVEYLPGHPVQGCNVVATRHQLLRNIPQRGKSLVIAADAAFLVSHQDSIRRRFERCPHLGQQMFEFLFDAALFGPAGNGDKIKDHVGTERRLGHPSFNRNRAAVVQEQRGFRIDRAAGACGDILPEKLVFRCRGQIDHAFADQFAVIHLEHGRRRLVGRHNPELDRVDQPDGLDHSVEKRLPRADGHHGDSPMLAPALTACSKK